MQLNNVISPFKEMLAYETLWAIEQEYEDIKEKKLKELFHKYTPSASLQELSKCNILSDISALEEIQNKVKKYLDHTIQLRSFSIVVNGNFQYPEGLNKATIPIGLFYYRGDLGILENKKNISVVGTRKPSAEGANRAKRLARELSKKFNIVSGLANGIDTIVYQAVIDGKGQTIGVIGTPINEYYPKENENLQNTIASKYLLISQVPFYKYNHETFNSHRFHFPRRNITMASLSEATVIVEASDTSGSLFQARECLKQGKKLFILDSCFNNPDIKWPKKYEKKGAIRVKKTEDILQHFE